MEINQQRIEDAIVADAVDRLVGDDDLYSRVKSGIAAKIDKLFAEVADARIRSEIETIIHDGFERSYQRVDAFGGKQGEPTSIRAELEKHISGYWNQRVDRDGRPTTSTYGDLLTRAEWQMTKLVAADFRGEMKQHVVNIGGALKDRLRAELRETLNKLLAEVFHVRTKDDEEAKRSDASIIPAKTTGAGA